MSTASSLSITALDSRRNEANGKAAPAGRELAKFTESESPDSALAGRAGSEQFRYKAAPSNMPLNQTRLFEESISGGNGRPVHAKMTSQFPSGGQPLPAMKASVFNR